MSTNIASSNVWYEMIRTGRIYAEIPEAAGTSKRRFLATL